jgi:dihydrofolate synthase/folylpolyglutamate synthase
VRFADAVADLDARQPEHMPKPDLDRIRAIAELLDEPQRTYPTIHVTGTNGKSTTARLISALACAHGLATGLFTSPHLRSVTERIEICGEPVAQSEFAEEYEHLLPVLETVGARVGRVTYFETLTALAFLWFADKPVELAVFEVGMGGTWDATNLIAGDVAVICPIGLDHPELGSTVAEVANEKAGIIKEEKVAVVRRQAGEALDVLERRCADVRATLHLEDRDWDLHARVPAVGGQALAVQGLHGAYEDLVLPLFGEFAARNAAAAIVAAEALLGKALDDEAVREAFASASSAGRVEVVARHPLIVLDGAHNPAAAEALAAALVESFTWERLHLVIAAFTNKDVQGVVARLAPLSDAAYAATTESVRARPASDIAEILESFGVPAKTFDDVPSALDAARAEAAPADLILVTGSLYTVANARSALIGSPRG